MFTKALGIWLYGLMCWLLPVERGVELTRNDPTTAETVEERDARYHGIADAIAEVVTSPDVVMPFKGKNGAVNSAGLLLAVTYKESGWRKDVDFGVGKRSRGKAWTPASRRFASGSARPTRAGRTRTSRATERSASPPRSV